MNTDRDKYLTEAMGECWHKDAQARRSSDDWMDWYCCKCGAFLRQAEWKDGEVLPFERLLSDYPTDFSIWQGFGKLWEWAQDQEWLDLFMCDTYYANYDTPHEAAMDNDGYLHADYINPDRFANAVYEFLKEREGK